MSFRALDHLIFFFLLLSWMNEFAALEDANDSAHPTSSTSRLQVDDLVTMTIVDVFETDNNGKLLSYCPTFDNRAVVKTTQTAETLRKGSNKIMSQISEVTQSPAAARVQDGMAQVTRLGYSAAKSMASTVQTHVSQQFQAMGNGNPPVANGSGKPPKPNNNSGSIDARGFEQALSEAEAAATVSTLPKEDKRTGNDTYISDDSTAQGES